MTRSLRRVLKGFAVLAVLGVLGIVALFGFLWVENRSEVTLPTPTGSFAVGRAIHDWTDSVALDPLAPVPGTKRELTMEHLRRIDINRSPVDGAPALAIEVISPSNLAQDTLKKVSQYLGAGSSAVWLAYPALGIVEAHKPGGIRHIKVPDSLMEEGMFGGRKFTLALTSLFTDPRGQPC